MCVYGGWEARSVGASLPFVMSPVLKGNWKQHLRQAAVGQICIFVEIFLGGANFSGSEIAKWQFNIYDEDVFLLSSNLEHLKKKIRW